MTKKKPHILLTNDDGIRSPGLWAAASELAKIGYVTVAAPIIPGKFVLKFYKESKRILWT